MTGWNTITRIRDLEQQADNLGMKFAQCHFNDFNANNVALIPRDQDTLPIYCRDAALFIGSLESAEMWMKGIVWARDYDRMIINRNMDKHRERKEQDVRNRQLLMTLKYGQVPKKENA